VLMIVAVKALKDSSLLYVFAWTWTPEFCFGQSYPGCTNTTNSAYSYWGSSMTIHGLWPQYIAGGYPASCTTETFNYTVVESLGYENFVKYWPDVQYAESSADYKSFWDHEWTKHGTCTGLSQSTYFSNALTVGKTATPSIISSNVGKSVSADSIREAFGGKTYASLQCESGKYFSGVYQCYNNVNGVPSGVTPCPLDVQAEDTCTSSSVTIEAF